MSVTNMLSSVTTDLSDHAANFEVLALTCTATKIAVLELRHYLEGLKAIEPSRDFYGDHAEAAAILLRVRIAETQARYDEMRKEWQTNLDELAEAVELTEEEITPRNAPNLLSALHSMETAKGDGFREDAFGDLLERATQVNDDAIKRFQAALARCALMVVDPDSVPPTYTGSIEDLDHALRMAKALPLTLEAFMGDHDKLAEAKRRHPIWVRKLEELRTKTLAERQQAAPETPQ